MHFPFSCSSVVQRQAVAMAVPGHAGLAPLPASAMLQRINRRTCFLRFHSDDLLPGRRLRRLLGREGDQREVPGGDRIKKEEGGQGVSRHEAKVRS